MKWKRYRSEAQLICGCGSRARERLRSPFVDWLCWEPHPASVFVRKACPTEESSVHSGLHRREAWATTEKRPNFARTGMCSFEWLLEKGEWTDCTSSNGVAYKKRASSLIGISVRRFPFTPKWFFFSAFPQNLFLLSWWEFLLVVCWWSRLYTTIGLPRTPPIAYVSTQELARVP